MRRLGEGKRNKIDELSENSEERKRARKFLRKWTERALEMTN